MGLQAASSPPPLFDSFLIILFIYFFSWIRGGKTECEMSHEHVSLSRVYPNHQKDDKDHDHLIPITMTVDSRYSVTTQFPFSKLLPAPLKEPAILLPLPLPLPQ